MAIYETTFALHARRRLGCDGKQIGSLLPLIGGSSLFVKALLLPFIAKHSRAGMSYLLVPMMVIQAAGLVGWGMSDHFSSVLLPMAALAVSQNTVDTIMDSRLAALVPAQSRGAIMGWFSSVDRIARIIAPTLGHYTLAQLGSEWVGVLAALFTAFSAGSLLFTHHLFQDIVTPKTD